MTDHAHWEDSAGAYVLDALDEHEKAGYEEHLKSCRACREEVDFLRVAADAIPSSVEQYAAPPALKDRIMTIVNSEAELLRAAGPEADRPRARQAAGRRWWQAVPRPALAFGAATLLVVGGALGWALRDGGSGQPLRTVVADVGLPGASASLIVREGDSTLVTRRLPRAGRGRVYQVWLKRKGAAAPEPTDALFAVRHDGTASVDVPGSLEDVEAVLVTREPEGGSQTPSEAPVITAVPA